MEVSFLGWAEELEDHLKKGAIGILEDLSEQFGVHFLKNVNLGFQTHYGYT